MKIQISLSDACRKARFLDGIETPSTVILEPPLDALTPAVRDAIWNLPYGNQQAEKDLQFPGDNQYRADVYPVTPDDWALLIGLYAGARSAWTEQQATKRAADAEKRLADFRTYLDGWHYVPGSDRFSSCKPHDTIITNARSLAWADVPEPLRNRYAEICAEYTRRQAEDAALRAQATRERDAHDEMEKTRRATEKKNWIPRLGSDYLQRGFTAGYDCQRQYVTERAAIEHPGFTVDFDDRAAWKSRPMPTPEALTASLAIPGSTVVWLTHGMDEDGDLYDGIFAECEAILIQGFLDKYNLVKIMD